MTVGFLASRIVRQYISVVLSHPVYSICFTAALGNEYVIHKYPPMMCKPQCSVLKVLLQYLSRTQLFVTLDCSQPGSSVRGISRSRILEWVTISFSSWEYGPVEKWAWLMKPISVPVGVEEESKWVSLPFSSSLSLLKSQRPLFLFLFLILQLTNCYLHSRVPSIFFSLQYVMPCAYVFPAI